MAPCNGQEGRYRDDIEDAGEGNNVYGVEGHRLGCNVHGEDYPPSGSHKDGPGKWVGPGKGEIGLESTGTYDVVGNGAEGANVDPLGTLGSSVKGDDVM